MAGTYPYNMSYRVASHHPVFTGLKTIHRMFPLPAHIQLGLAVIKQDAADQLKGRTVRHFEVVSDETTFGWYALVVDESEDGYVG